MKITDHFLSDEVFEVKPSQHKGILQTIPQPSEDKLAQYYESAQYISHQTSAKSFKDKVYHRVKSYMISIKKSKVLEHHQQGNILDIGAGTGDFLDAFNSESWIKFSIEPSVKLHSKLNEKGIHLKAHLEEFEDLCFDVITLWHSLEHIPNLDHTIKHLKRIIKPNGIIFIAVPNYNSFDAKFYKSYWAAWDVPRHLWHFSRSGLKSVFYKYGFSCTKERGMPFDAFYVSMLSEQYKSNGNFLSAFLIGALSNLKALFTKEYSSVIYVLKPLTKENNT